MDLEDLKKNYKNEGLSEKKSAGSLMQMKKWNNHPILKGIKRQLIFESIIWAIILIVFYDFFDGHLKSLLWNVILVCAIVLVLLHNILGLLIVKSPINDTVILLSLKNYLRRIKRYANLSIVSRVLAVIVFTSYLMSTADWNMKKIGITAIAFFCLVAIQVIMLRKVWKKRVDTIKHTLESF